MSRMATHGMPTVVTQLRLEETVDGGYQLRILRDVVDFRALR